MAADALHRRIEATNKSSVCACRNRAPATIFPSVAPVHLASGYFMFKFVIIAVAIVAAGFSVFYALRRSPVCAGEGKYMSTQSECEASGFAPDICKQAIEKARAVVVRAAPKSETMFQCEVRFSDCFQSPEGGFTPLPSFCLRPNASADPSEVRYLEYESDRKNRKKMKEVRVD